ncbi:S-layer homology domain-containing protein [Wukongibacter sp. M2B1]|uniref:S-layer homology domain-containing protein n=1 Tax=Wukongibacter sp. M2B1 TaxID=3088895 RepID=UPI003D7C04E0
MRKNFGGIILIVVCQIVLLTGMAFADVSGNQDTYLSQKTINSNVVEKIENKNTEEEANKEKINELYVELADEKLLKNVLPRLEAFGIVKKTPGEEHDLKKEVTREQLAKLMIAVLNMEKEAKDAQNLNLYTDISADRWSAGYVNLAGSLGIIDEKDEGVFSPEESVTYPEAIAGLIRVLGYKDEFLPGSWPGNYIAKAADLDITDDVEFNPSGVVDRGDILILINNTLKASGIEKTVEDDGAIMYSEYNDTFLKKKFGIDKYDGVKILKAKKYVNNEGEAGEVKVEFSNDTYDGKYKIGDVKIFKLLNESDLEKLEDIFAEEITVYVKDEIKVIYIEE